MLGKAGMVRTHFVDADCVGDLENYIEAYLEVISHLELIDIRHQMMYVKGSEMLYHTAMIIYKEESQ